jgi:hypothetical protein
MDFVLANTNGNRTVAVNRRRQLTVKQKQLMYLAFTVSLRRPTFLIFFVVSLGRRLSAKSVT